MKNRLLWLAIFAVGGMALYCGIMRPEVSAIPASVREPLDELKPLPIPAPEAPALVIAPPVFAPPAISNARPTRLPELPVVPIQPGATIDFSSGGPVVKVQGADKEALEQALKEMAEATKDVSIQPRKN
jgi:hypothetical protein